MSTSLATIAPTEYLDSRVVDFLDIQPTEHLRSSAPETPRRETRNRPRMRSGCTRSASPKSFVSSSSLHASPQRWTSRCALV